MAKGLDVIECDSFLALNPEGGESALALLVGQMVFKFLNLLGELFAQFKEAAEFLEVQHAVAILVTFRKNPRF